MHNNDIITDNDNDKYILTKITTIITIITANLIL